MKKLILVLVLVGLTAAFVLADTFYLKNSTGFWTFYDIRVSYNRSNDWGSDVLGNDVLEPDEVLRITTTRSLNTDTLDFKIIDEDGDTYTIYGRRVRDGQTIEITLDDLD